MLGWTLVLQLLFMGVFFPSSFGAAAKFPHLASSALFVVLLFIDWTDGTKAFIFFFFKKSNSHGSNCSLLPCRLVPDNEHRQPDCCTRGGFVPVSLSLPLWGIMCLYVTLLSLRNADYVLRGPMTPSPMALIDSKAQRMAAIRLTQKEEHNPSLQGRSCM